VRLRNLRFLTHVAVICLCGLTLLKGVSLFRFVLAEAADPGAARAAALEPFFSTSGVSAQARRDAYPANSAVQDADEAAGRVNKVSAVLAEAPLSASDWLLLAQMRRAADDSPDGVVSALAMSTVTGPNEGYVIFNRAPFELQVWDLLPHDGRLAAANDIASLTPALSARQRAILRRTIAAKSDETRQFLKDALERAYGVKPITIEELGLAKTQDQASEPR
jgi:hypothetical protein